MTIRRLPLPILLLPLLLLSACSGVFDTAPAEVAVEEFRARYDAGEFAAIYAGSHSAMHEATSEAEFLEFMKAVRRKLGPVRSAARTGFHVNVTTAGRRVQLGYRTEFENGEGEELFVWHLSGDSARLVGYNVNSRALIVN